MSEAGASSKGKQLIKAWQQSVEREARARREMTEAGNAERDARKALGGWLMPSDAKPNETFSIWDRDQHDQEVMFEVKCCGAGSIPEIRTRARR
ncbi:MULTISPECIES: hypothetical protein [unclassified Bradyrhizobium]|uniref:hypothetical protein n=1 Tax=unclassified Bradyrhizobium TaxID=2631580 RepID=UPI0029170B45|nr:MULTISPECIES: hypothetical protein [unclassified Bradyrhizobium]